MHKQGQGTTTTQFEAGNVLITQNGFSSGPERYVKFIRGVENTATARDDRSQMDC